MKRHFLPAVIVAILVFAYETAANAVPTYWESSFGTRLDFFDANDDDQVNENIGFSFSFYGTNYSSLYIHDNGNVTFTTGGTLWSGDSTAFQTEWPRIAPLGQDFDPTEDLGRPASYGIYFNNTVSDKFIVTWNDLEEYGMGDHNTFQMVLYSGTYSDPAFRNVIQFGYDTVDTTGNLVGVSKGGVGNTKYTIFGGSIANLDNPDKNLFYTYNSNTGQYVQSTSAPNAVAPEPSTISFLGIGLVGLLAYNNRKRLIVLGKRCHTER